MFQTTGYALSKSPPPPNPIVLPPADFLSRFLNIYKIRFPIPSTSPPPPTNTTSHRKYCIKKNIIYDKVISISSLSFQMLRCQRKEPCRLFTVRKRLELLDEVNTNGLCQCPHNHYCPRHHTDAGVIQLESFVEENIRTYSGYCLS